MTIICAVRKALLANKKTDSQKNASLQHCIFHKLRDFLPVDLLSKAGKKSFALARAAIPGAESYSWRNGASNGNGKPTDSLRPSSRL